MEVKLWLKFAELKNATLLITSWVHANNAMALA